MVASSSELYPLPGDLLGSYSYCAACVNELSGATHPQPPPAPLRPAARPSDWRRHTLSGKVVIVGGFWVATLPLALGLYTVGSWLQYGGGVATGRLAMRTLWAGAGLAFVLWGIVQFLRFRPWAYWFFLAAWTVLLGFGLLGLRSGGGIGSLARTLIAGVVLWCLGNVRTTYLAAAGHRGAVDGART